MSTNGEDLDTDPKGTDPPTPPDMSTERVVNLLRMVVREEMAALRHDLAAHNSDEIRHHQAVADQILELTARVHKLERKSPPPDEAA